MLVVTVLVDGGDQEALGANKVREVKKPPAEQTEQLSFTAKKT